VHPADLGQRRERRPQHQRGRRPLGGQPQGHGRAERLAEEDHAGRVDLGPPGQVGQGRPGIGGQPVGGRLAGVAAVAAVVEQQHMQTQPGQGGGQRRPQRAVAAIAVADQDRRPRPSRARRNPTLGWWGPRRGSVTASGIGLHRVVPRPSRIGAGPRCAVPRASRLRWYEPAAEPQPVGGREADLFGPGQDRGGGWDRPRGRQVDQPALERPQQPERGQQDGRHDHQDDPNSHPPAVP
jgi:hypothetical protein